MYGMVNRALQEHIVQRAGPAAWAQISKRTGAPSSFSDSITYDDSLTYAVVEAAGEVLDLPAEEILEGFGRDWIRFTSQAGWGPVFDMAGTDLRSFIAGLDELHARVQAAMPQSEMPTFVVGDTADGAVELEYRSGRPGLTPMVAGLLHGLVEHFREPWTVRHLGRVGGREGEVFVLEPDSTEPESIEPSPTAS